MHLVSERAIEKNPKILCVCFSVLVCLFLFYRASVSLLDEWGEPTWSVWMSISTVLSFFVQWNTCILSTSFTIKTVFTIKNLEVFKRGMVGAVGGQSPFFLNSVWMCLKRADQSWDTLYWNINYWRTERTSKTASSHPQRMAFVQTWHQMEPFCSRLQRSLKSLFKAELDFASNYKVRKPNM